jgi:hypothetical protein
MKVGNKFLALLIFKKILTDFVHPTTFCQLSDRSQITTKEIF